MTHMTSMTCVNCWRDYQVEALGMVAYAATYDPRTAFGVCDDCGKSLLGSDFQSAKEDAAARNLIESLQPMAGAKKAVTAAVRKG